MTENDDVSIRDLLRTCLAPIEEESPPRDVWPELLSRIQERPHPSRLDLGLLAALLLLAPLFPRTLLLLIYSL